MGTYVADRTNGIAYPNVTDWNTSTQTYTVEYDEFEGYKWITFDASPTSSSVRWIIIGSGSTASTILSLTTEKGTQIDTLDLSENQILLLSEKVLASSIYWPSYTSIVWTESTLCTYINTSTNYNSWGISDALYSLIVAPNLITTSQAYKERENVTATSKKIFTLAEHGFKGDNFGYGTYLPSSTARIAYNSSNKASKWWLRTGRNYNYWVYAVTNTGGIGYQNYGDDGQGVRPCFVLNLV